MYSHSVEGDTFKQRDSCIGNRSSSLRANRRFRYFEPSRVLKYFYGGNFKACVDGRGSFSLKLREKSSLARCDLEIVVVLYWDFYSSSRKVIFLFSNKWMQWRFPVWCLIFVKNLHWTHLFWVSLLSFSEKKQSDGVMLRCNHVDHQYERLKLPL